MIIFILTRRYLDLNTKDSQHLRNTGQRVKVEAKPKMQGHKRKGKSVTRTSEETLTKHRKVKIQYIISACETCVKHE